MSEQPTPPTPMKKKNLIIAVLGALLILIGVIFMNYAEDILSADANLQNWFIGAVIATLVGWVMIFVGLLGNRK